MSSIVRSSERSTPSTVVAPLSDEAPVHAPALPLPGLPTEVIPPQPAADTLSSLINVARATWLNVLLVFIPIGWAVHFARVNPVIIFACNFIAIIPLAALLSFATEDLAGRVGQQLGGLINATLGNAVELIVAIIALTQCKLAVVQSSLIGSILSNLLLVLGMCFFAGGIRYSEQIFLVTPSQLNSSLLFISVVATLLPAVFHSTIVTSNDSDYIRTDDILGSVQGVDILKMSRGVAVMLLVVYLCYLAFTLWSHLNLMDEKPSGHSTLYPPNVNMPLKAKRDEEWGTDTVSEPSKMNVIVTVALMAGVTALVAITSDFLISSIDGLTATGAISEEWLGLILIPIVGNAAEHATAVTVSVRDKLDLAINVAVGSSIQIALFVIPFVVVLGWIMNKPLTMLFNPFQSAVLLLAVVTVNYTVRDGKSNWLEGVILMVLYAIIAVCFWFYPNVDPTLGLSLTC